MLKMFSQTDTACKAPKDLAREERTAPEKMSHIVVFVPGDLDL